MRSGFRFRCARPPGSGTSHEPGLALAPFGRPVVEADAIDAAESRNGALPVVHLAVRPPEALLVQVAADVLAADVVPGALDRALEQAVEGLNGVRVDGAARVLALGVVDRVVTARELAS